MTSTTTSKTSATFYVRSLIEAAHEYEGPETASRALCIRCGVTHSRPASREWHIESEEVDVMLCGVRIDLDDGDVRQSPAKAMCHECAKKVRDARRS